MDQGRNIRWQWAFVLIGYPGMPSLDSGSGTGPYRDGSCTAVTSAGILPTIKFFLYESLASGCCLLYKGTGSG
ncbi:MAG TPA: hypothetical protein VM912_06050, partial [Terriglobales bacterium]|nr:hypothetical protein [Terriglobales bacterium]